jgi:hypothetical protein
LAIHSRVVFACDTHPGLVYRISLSPTIGRQIILIAASVLVESLAEDDVRGCIAPQLDVAGRPGSLLGDRNRLAGVMKGDREVLRDRCDCRVVGKLDRDGDRMNSIIRASVLLIVGVYDESHRCRSDCAARCHPGRAESIRFGSAVVSS